MGIYGYNIDEKTGKYSLLATLLTDTDNDRILDYTDSDDDNDGISDTQEISNGLNPLDKSDTQADFDNDGFNNAIEISVGTDIRSANSKPIWTPIMMGDLMIMVPIK